MKRPSRWFLAGAALLAGSLLLAPDPERAPRADDGTADAWASDVRPFLGRYCSPCHEAGQPAAIQPLALFGDGPGLETDPELWRKTLAKLRSGEMPPKNAPRRPGAAEREKVVAWLEGKLAPGPGAPADPGRVTLRRLNRVEYANSVRDLLGVDVAVADDFPEDDVGYGFDGIGDVLTVSPMLFEKYLATAERVANEAVRVVRPTRTRWEAEDMDREGNGGERGGWAVLFTSGEFAEALDVATDGTYVLTARVYGQQAGPERVRAAFRVDGREAGRFETASVQSDPEVLETRVALKAGRRRVAVAFLNDYYQPQHEDPRQRDRNMAVDWLEVEGPVDPPPPSAAQERILRRTPSGPDDVAAAAREALEPIAERAYRRPVRPEEVARLAGLVTAAVADGDPFERGIQVALTAILVSPHFLFRVETDPVPGVHPVTEFELATRLSYFLWSSLPDDELLAAAGDGTLRRDLAAHVRRLLDDPRSRALVENFGGQWLQTRRLERAAPDAAAFAGFDDELRRAMRLETEMFFEAVLRENRDVRDFLDARFTFVNDRLAKHYRLAGVEGSHFRRVTLPAGRGGVLTHASVLTVTSNPTRTSPVKRGKWVLETLLGDAPPPPPPGVDALPEDAAAHAATSLRARLEVHRKDPACAVCHERMDEIGFALENFDGIGAWRTRDGRFDVDARARIDGEDYESATGLVRYLRSRSDDFVRTLAGKLLTYALGRGLGSADEEAIDRMLRDLGPEVRFQDLVLALVRLDAFQMRRAEEAR